MALRLSEGLGRAGVDVAVLLDKALLLVACVAGLGELRKLFEQCGLERSKVEARRFS